MDWIFSNLILFLFLFCQAMICYFEIRSEPFDQSNGSDLI